MAELNSGMTVYDWVQQEVENAKPFSKNEVTVALTNIGEWFSSNLKNKYYMLLNKELSDYTVFNFTTHNFYVGTKELEEVLESRGTILKIEYNHNNNYYEIWVKYNGDNRSHMYILFECNDFVIEI